MRLNDDGFALPNNAKKKKKEAKPRAPVRLPTSDERGTVGEDGREHEREDGGQRE